MGAGMVSERDPAPRRRAAVRSRQEIIRARIREGVLVRRAKGFKRERIAYEIRRTVDEVSRILRAARAAGEPRALTDKEASAAAAVLAERNPRLAAEIQAGDAEVPAVVDAPPAVSVAPVCEPASECAPLIPARPAPRPALAPMPAAPESRSGLDPARMSASQRERVVAGLREAAGPERRPFEGMSPRAHLHHLADLYAHCGRFYPEHEIHSDGLALRFVPEPATLGGGAALMCSQA